MPIDTYALSWILLLAGVAITAIAQARISAAFNRYKQVASRSGITGQEVARRLLDDAGLQQIPVRLTGGNLTDNYDPSNGVLNLSRSTYDSTSVAALGVAAHECGHAMQDAEGYAPLRVRSLMVPVARFGSSGSWVIIVLGVLLSSSRLVLVGVLLFLAVVAFQLITLPVEFNASRRAMAALESGGYLTAEELPMTGKVLRAAALTYVAAALSSILQLLRLLLIYGNRRR